MKELIAKEKELLQYKEILEERIAHAPEGYLRCSKSNNCVQYYYRSKDKERGKEIWNYIPKKEIELAKKIAQRDYDISVKEHIEECLKEIHRLIDNDINKKLENEYIKLNHYRREIIKPIIISNEQYAREWMEISYQSKPFREDAPEIYTEKGERVRSKSEKIIADYFNREGIPYRYEFPLYLRGYGTIHPDFTVLNKNTRKEYLWEHLGMMDDAEYVNNSIKRIEMYEKNGYIMGRDIIITHETYSRPINMKVVCDIVNYYLA